MAERWGTEEAQALLAEIFAPWAQALGLRVVAVDAAGARFLLPGNPALTRGGGEGSGTVCGQAIAAAADSAAVVALAAHNGRFRPCTTVDMTTHFLRPMPEGDVEIIVTVLSNGRRMAAARAEFRALPTASGGAADARLGATATCGFAYLDT
jgi:uncharacterized protein (TIGR00369 family)